MSILGPASLFIRATFGAGFGVARHVSAAIRTGFGRGHELMKLPVKQIASDSFALQVGPADSRRVNAPGRGEPNDALRIKRQQFPFSQTKHVGTFGVSKAAQLQLALNIRYSPLIPQCFTRPDISAHDFSIRSEEHTSELQ